MTEKTLTTENIKPALDALRGELAPWPVVAKKQDRLNTAQLNAANSGITSSLVAQIIANTAAIRALESAITGTGLRALVVATLPAVGTTGILYIVPVTTYDPETDADVVNYSNEYIWIPVEAGQASEGHYEQVGQTGIVINNGQLTITVNGTSVGTFTANQSGDTTAAITVPTNADYVDLSTDQTVAGVKTFSDGIVGNVTGTASRATADEDGNNIKSALAGKQPSLSQAQLDACNSGITASAVQQIGTNASNISSLQTAVSSKAADADVVHKAGAETITGDKTWTGQNTFSGWVNATGFQQTKATISTDVAPSSTQYFGYNYANNADGKTLLHHRAFVSANTLNTTLRYWINPNTSTGGNYGGFQIMTYGDGSTVATFKPRGNMEPYDPNYGANLGSSSNKWKTLNGINPGALGMIDTSTYVEIDTSAWNTTGSANLVQINGANPTFPGYLFIRTAGTNTDYIAVRVGGSSSGFPLWTAPYHPVGGGMLHVIVPCPANTAIRVYITVAPPICRYFACLGNV